MDDFMRDAAVSLGVSQHAMENEYYVVDIPTLLDKKRELDAQERLLQISAMTAAHSVSFDENSYGKYIAQLSAQAGGNNQRKKESEFDRESFERLRALTNAGANRR